VRLTLTGKILKQDNRLTLRLDDVEPQQPSFELIPYRDKSHNANQPQDVLSQELEKQVGKTVEVEGYWREAQKGGSMPTLRVTRCASSPPE